MDPVGTNRFSPITSDNHAGSLWIASLLCLVYSVVTLSLRGHLRWNLFGLDDYLALGAVAGHLGVVIAIIIGLQHGIGQTQELLGESDLKTAAKSAFAAQILFILSAAALKSATLYLMMRLFNLSGSKVQNQTRSRSLYWACVIILAGMGFWAVLAIIAVSVNCSMSGFFEVDPAHCPNQFLRWQLITAFDVLTECVLVLFSMLIVWPVQLSITLKMQVVMAFAFRLPLAALSIIHLHYVSEFTKSSNPGLALIPVLVIQQVQLCWSLISATIPNLKAFVKSFSSGFGIQLDPSQTQAYGSSSRYGRGTGYELGSVRADGISKSRSGNASYNDIEGPTALPQEGQKHDNQATGRDQESINSGGSQDHIIRKDVRWKIHYETDDGHAS